MKTLALALLLCAAPAMGFETLASNVSLHENTTTELVLTNFKDQTRTLVVPETISVEVNVKGSAASATPRFAITVDPTTCAGQTCTWTNNGTSNSFAIVIPWPVTTMGNVSSLILTYSYKWTWHPGSCSTTVLTPCNVTGDCPVGQTCLAGEARKTEEKPVVREPWL